MSSYRDLYNAPQVQSVWLMPKNNWHIPTWKTLSGQQNHLMSQRQITYEIRHVVAVVSIRPCI